MQRMRLWTNARIRSLFCAGMAAGCAAAWAQEQKPETPAPPASPTLQAPAVQAPISRDRIERLARGVNLNGWFGAGNLDSSRFANYLTDAEIGRIQSAGFRHVRLPIDPILLFDEHNPQTLRTDALPAIDAAIRRLTDKGLAVILACYPSEDFADRLTAEPAFAEAFEVFWAAQAEHWNSTPAALVYFELLSEPTFPDPAAWNELLAKLVRSVRAKAPEHTLILTPSVFDSRGIADMTRSLTETTPTTDRNAVYSWHFYQPMVFTQQGSERLKRYQALREVPYPSTPERVASLVDKLPANDAKRRIKEYGDERWDAERIRSTIAPVARWAREHNTTVIASEIGVSNKASPVSRRRYLQDLRKTLEDAGIGWSVWAYTDAFGITERGADGRAVDPEIAPALGL